jgi:hypothetical protein
MTGWKGAARGAVGGQRSGPTPTRAYWPAIAGKMMILKVHEIIIMKVQHP